MWDNESGAERWSLPLQWERNEMSADADRWKDASGRP